jgi:hypothetical protein
MGETPGRFLIACPEKALCDELYRIAGIRSIQGVEALLFEDLRLDLDEFRQLDLKVLRDLSAYYHTSTLQAFGKFLQRRRHA